MPTPLGWSAYASGLVRAGASGRVQPRRKLIEGVYARRAQEALDAAGSDGLRCLRCGWSRLWRGPLRVAGLRTVGSPMPEWDVRDLPAARKRKNEGEADRGGRRER